MYPVWNPDHIEDKPLQSVLGGKPRWLCRIDSEHGVYLPIIWVKMFALEISAGFQRQPCFCNTGNRSDSLLPSCCGQRSSDWNPRIEARYR